MANIIENSISSKMFLEFTVHILEYGYFNPIVFCHDNYCFDRQKYAHVSIGFLNLLLFLDSAGVLLDARHAEISDAEEILYKNILCEERYAKSIICYELESADFSNLNIANAVTPEGCHDEDFSLVKLYLQMRTGASLNKKAIENVLHQELSDSGLLTVRRNLEAITGHEIVKRDDNSYEMRLHNA